MIKMNFKLDKIKLKENGLEQEIKGSYDFLKKNNTKGDRTFCLFNSNSEDSCGCEEVNVCLCDEDLGKSIYDESRNEDGSSNKSCFCQSVSSCKNDDYDTGCGHHCRIDY